MDIDDKICSACIEGDYFSEWIKKNGMEDSCDFCASTEVKSVFLEDLIQEVDTYFREHYSEGEIYYTISTDSDNVETNYHGEPYEEILYEILCCDDPILRFIIANLPDCTGREIQQGEIPFYSGMNFELNSDRKRREELDEAEYYCYIATSKVVDLKEKLGENILLLKELLKKLDPSPELSDLQLRMIFSSAITSLESYLFDVFSKVLFSDYMDKSEIYEKYLMSEMNKEKFDLCNIYKVLNELESKIKSDLYRKSFHNMNTAKKMYLNIFSVDLSSSKEFIIISNHIPKRHDFVHRGNKDEKGSSVITSIEEIKNLLQSIESFSSYVDGKMQSIVEKNVNAPHLEFLNF